MLATEKKEGGVEFFIVRVFGRGVGGGGWRVGKLQRLFNLVLIILIRKVLPPPSPQKRGWGEYFHYLYFLLKNIEIRSNNKRCHRSRIANV